MDLFPTLVGLLDLQLPDEVELDGVDLSGALTGRESGPEVPAYSHTSLISLKQLAATPGLTLRDRYHPEHDPWYMWTLIREGDLVFKLQYEGDGNWDVRAFDWTLDPGETKDLYDSSNPHHAEMLDRLKAYKKTLVERFPEGERDLSVEEKRERLRSVGYIN